VRGKRAIRCLPGAPTTIEQTHVTHSPKAQDPPDAGSVFARVVVVDHDARLLVDTQFADPPGPRVVILSSNPSPAPAHLLNPYRPGDVAGEVRVFAAGVEDAELLGHFRPGKLSGFQEQFRVRIAAGF